MKKLFAILLAAMMVLSMTTIAFAADEGNQVEDTEKATFKVKYTATNGGTQPEETFTFSEFECVSVTDAAEGVNTTNAPVPAKIADVTLNSTTTEKDVEITLPSYESVGVYTYQFKQNVGTTAGLTYYKDGAEQNMTLVVSVIEQNGKVRVAAVHVEAGSTPSDKTGVITNTYESGTLAVSKTVTGNMGDKTKYFDVKVTFTAASGEVINSTITYNGGKYSQPVTVENNEATIQVKHGDTVTFTNIPEGVTWKVEEADYTGEEYDAASYSKQTDTMAAGGEATCAITNNKETTIDTGIVLDSLPYILIGAVAMAAAVVMIAKKRRVED